MKKILGFLMSLAFVAVAILACNKVQSEVVKVTRLSLNETAVVLRKGDVKKLIATTTPSNAVDHSVVWTTTNSSVVTVEDGLITAVEVGKASVHATTADGRKRATCEVEVIAEYIPVQGVMIMNEEGTQSLNDTTITLTEGDTYVATVQVRPGDATNPNVSWKSNSPTVASVKDGVIKAGSNGTATITVTTDAGQKTASFKITVKPYVPPVDVTGVSLNKSSISLATIGATYQLVATVAPADATQKDVRWSTSNASIVTVENGLVKAVAPGKATITVRTVDQGKTATCEVEVRGFVTGVSLNKTALTLTVGTNGSLTATVLPSDAINKNVTWSSSDDSIVTVSNGTVTAVASGIATVTVTTVEGAYTAKCTVIVVTGSSDGVNGGFDEFGEEDFGW